MTNYKVIRDGYIVCINHDFGTEITEAEYAAIVSVVNNKPSAEIGYDYRLKVDLTWELVELPPVPEDDEEITLEDALAKLRELGVDV